MDIPSAVRPRLAARWALTHGLVSAANYRAAHDGNLMARLMTDASMREDPFEVYEALRALGPLPDRGVVSLTAHHDMAMELLRSETFGVPNASVQMPGPLGAFLRRTEREDELGPVDPPSLLATNPPEHTRLRKLVARSFTARRVREMTADIERTTRELLDGLPTDREVDLVEEFAARLPVAVIGQLLGVPEEEWPQLLAWGNEGAKQLDMGLGYAEFTRSVDAVRAMHHWFDAHLARLQANPGSDLLSSLIQTVEEMDPAERPTGLEMRAVGMLVLGAGFETTVNLIGNAVALLHAHPDQRSVCLQDPSRWGDAVEEVLRFDSPVQFTARTSLRPVELAGRQLPRGHTVLILLGAVNRDPQVFEDPHRFRVTRENASDHLAFSMGAHFCLGAQLARLETTVALRELYARFPDLRVTGSPVRRTTRVLRGFETLPVRLA